MGTGPKLRSCPSLKLPSPDQYLFHCSIQNNAGGDETTFAFAVILITKTCRTGKLVL
jgi:hypothetical protein